MACGGGGGGGSEAQRLPSQLAYDYVDGFTNMAPTTTAELNALRDSMAQSSPDGVPPLLTYEGRGRIRVIWAPGHTHPAHDRRRRSREE
jgi:hypothetical protein